MMVPDSKSRLERALGELSELLVRLFVNNCFEIFGVNERNAAGGFPRGRIYWSGCEGRGSSASRPPRVKRTFGDCGSNSGIISVNIGDVHNN